MMVKKLEEAIERNNLKTLTLLKVYFSEEEGKNLIDEPFTKTKNLDLSPLAYALFVGRFKSFSHLVEKLGASISAMEELLLKQGESVMSLICSKGYLDFLKFYLPIYLNGSKNTEAPVEDSMTMDFERPHLVAPSNRPTSTPVQLACENEHLVIIDHVYNFLSG